MNRDEINREAIAFLQEARDRALIDIDVTDCDIHREVDNLLLPYTNGWCSEKDMLLKLNSLHLIVRRAKERLFQEKISTFEV